LRGVTELRKFSPSQRNTTPLDFASVISGLLDKFDATDFRGAERILEAMRRQGRTVSGNPRIRPRDCDHVLRAIRDAFEANRPLFVTGDSAIIARFDQILDAFAETDLCFYPREMLRARILHAEAKLLLNDPAGVRRLIGEYADRLYKIEGIGANNAIRTGIAARRLRREASGLNPLHPANRARLAHPKSLASSPTRLPSVHRSNQPFPKIVRKSHASRPPSPAHSLNQNNPDSEIPSRFTTLGNRSSLRFRTQN
jgi:hypothetical protein